MLLLHTMSLAGSIAAALYLLLHFLTRRYLPLLWHKVYLVVTILLFLMPLAWFKTEYTGLINKYLGYEAWYQRDKVVKDMMDSTIFVYQDSIYTSNTLVYIAVFLSVLLGIGGLIILTGRYLAAYQKLLKGMRRFERGERAIRELTKGRKRLAKIGVYLCDGLRTPITIGIIHGKIILPAVVWEDERLEYALYHELAHVRAKDNLVKVVLVFVALLNFYNPLVYYLLYQWDLVAEMYCDYKATESKSLRETGDYIKLLIDFAENKKTGTMPMAGLNLSEKHLKERIENMKRMKKTGKKFGKISKAAGVTLIAAAIFASSLTVYAYEERKIWYLDTPYEKVDDLIWYDDWERDGRTELDIKYDAYEKYANANDVIFFVSETGEVYYNVYTETEQMRKACNHTYDSGTLSKHTKDGKGGCRLDYYDGKRCSKCGYSVYGDYIKSSVYAVCPH